MQLTVDHCPLTHILLPLLPTALPILHLAGTIEGVSFQPRDIPVGPVRLQLGSGEVIEGLEDALIGMRQGGKRRVLIPPELGYVSSVLQPQPPTFATKRQLANHSSESLLFEIALLRVIPT